LQHLAGRYLLKYLFPDFPHEEILIADTRKPYLPNEQYHFSISHCGDYAAAIVSSTHRVGIDIEIPSIKVQRIAHKFIHENEKQWLDEFSVSCFQFSGQQAANNEQKDITVLHAPPLEQRPVSGIQPETENYKLETILWSAKEAIFKWYSLGEVDFKDHMQLSGTIKKLMNEDRLLPFLFQKTKPIELNIVSKIFEVIVLSWIATES
jgi:4'-phosphopantetheinyl transferase EntD